MSQDVNRTKTSNGNVSSESSQHRPSNFRFGSLVRLTHTFRRRARTSSRSSSSKVKARFPKNPVDYHVKEDEIEARAHTIEDYFHRIFNSKQRKTYRNLKEFETLFGLSKFTYIKEFGPVGYEGDMDKQSGGERQLSCFIRMTRCQFGGWWRSWTSKEPLNYSFKIIEKNF